MCCLGESLGYLGAQLLLHRPRWIVIDNVDDLLAGKDGERAASLLRSDLAQAAVLAMGTGEDRTGLFTRTLRLLPVQADGGGGRTAPSTSRL